MQLSNTQDSQEEGPLNQVEVEGKPLTVVLDFDDFSPRNTNFGLLEELHEHFPDFKVTLFTVPWEIRFGEQTPITEDKFSPFTKAIRKASDWIEIALHGFTHAPREFENIPYEKAKKRIIVAEKMFINQKMPYAKLFKAPQWLLSEDGKRAAEDLGFVVVEDGGYNWNLKDERPDGDFLWGHGHIQMEMDNGLEEVMPKLMQLPADTQFIWLSEHLEADRVDSEKQYKQQQELHKELIKNGQN